MLTPEINREPEEQFEEDGSVVVLLWTSEEAGNSVLHRGLGFLGESRCPRCAPRSSWQGLRSGTVLEVDTGRFADRGNGG